jgi:integrase
MYANQQWLNLRGTYHFESPFDERNFIRHFKQTLKSAGLPDIWAHDLMHSHASLLLASGINPK